MAPAAGVAEGAGGSMCSNKGCIAFAACVCMYVCMYACMYACMNLCMHVRMYVFMYVCMYVCRHGWMDGLIDVPMFVCKYEHTHSDIVTYIHIPL